MEKTIPKELELASKLVSLMDDAFVIPIINKRIGLDPLIGLLPVLGDAISTIISLLIVAALMRYGAPLRLVFLMLINLGADFLIGSIPVVGDVWDFFYKANRKNLQMLIDHHSQKQLYDQNGID